MRCVWAPGGGGFKGKGWVGDSRSPGTPSTGTGRLLKTEQRFTAVSVKDPKETGFGELRHNVILLTGLN